MIPGDSLRGEEVRLGRQEADKGDECTGGSWGGLQSAPQNCLRGREAGCLSVSSHASSSEGLGGVNRRAALAHPGHGPNGLVQPEGRRGLGPEAVGITRNCPAELQVGPGGWGEVGRAEGLLQSSSSKTGFYQTDGTMVLEWVSSRTVPPLK